LEFSEREFTIQRRIDEGLKPERSAEFSRPLVLLPLALCGRTLHGVSTRPVWLEAKLLLKLAGDCFAFVIVEGIRRQPPFEVDGQRDDVNFSVPMLVVFDYRKHRPVQTFKLCEAQDDPHLRRRRQNVFLRHTEDSVQDIDFNIWSQRCQSFKVLAQFFFAATGHVGDKQFASLLMFSSSRLILISSLLAFRGIIQRIIFIWSCPVCFAAIPIGRRWLFAAALVFRRASRLDLP
jgi:hypothetical protein